MTQLELARSRIISPLAKHIARDENVSAGKLLAAVARGTAVIPANKKHLVRKPCGIGKGLRTKINANIGTSTDKASLREELVKLDAAIKYGADAIMDLSVGGDLPSIRKQIIKRSTVPVGTVPVYEIAVNAKRRTKNSLDFDASDVLQVLAEQAAQGVDFFTIHSGVTRKSIGVLRRNRRVMDIVSRGGAIIAAWMKRTGKENPFYQHFDEILKIARCFDVTLSLGDGLRPGSILDATDKSQIAELKILGELALRAREKGVQVMIEGPGHVPLDQIEENIRLQKQFCHGAPFYVLGPLVTDVASGYDHINASIGGALAASFGADFLCYVTPAEHLRHPSVADVREGVIASRISAHAADIVKRVPHAILWDKKMSEARKKRDWRKQIALSIDPEKAKEYRESSKPTDSAVCTMCGEYCSIKLVDSCL